MTTTVAFDGETGAVFVTHGGYKFWVRLDRIDAAYRALAGMLDRNGAAMERAECRLMDCLRAAMPDEQDASHDLALAMGLWLFRMAAEDWPAAGPALLVSNEEAEVWEALVGTIAYDAANPVAEPSDYAGMREWATEANVPYMPTSCLRRIAATIWPSATFR